MNGKERIEVPKPGDRVLWIRFVLFGDVLESLADAHNFKRRFPEIHLTFLTYPRYAEFVRTQPYIDDVLSGYKRFFREWRELDLKIRAGRYKWLINNHVRGKTSLLALLRQAERRIGSPSFFLFKFFHHMSVERFSRLCDVNINDRSLPSVFAAEEDRHTAVKLLAGLPERRLFAVIGASKVEKRWPEKGWIEFLRPLVNEGWGVVLNGHGPREEKIGRHIESALASRNVLNLVGALDFAKMSGVISHCTLAIGNDTGPLHLAALGGVPTIGLFNHPAKAKAHLDLLNIPWFRALYADSHIPRAARGLPLGSLPSETVAHVFGAFEEEFLPKAFAWRDNSPR